MKLLLDTLQRVVGGYIRGQFLLCGLVGLLVGIGMQVIGVPYALLLGVLAFVLEFIPVLGTLVSGVLVWGGIGYLVVFGSWIGYSAYIYLLEHVPTPKVATYAYVNPIVAVFLGWIILREHVDIFMLLGTAIIIASVALVNTSRLKQSPVDIQVSDETCPKTVNVAGD